jgi:hypothetical protein
MASDLTLVRIAENQSTFRAANENIETAAEEMGLDGEVPFICECPDRGCTQIVRLTLAAYAEVRGHPRHFFTVPGHESTTVQDGASAIIEEREGYVLVEKIGVAGAIAEERFNETELKADG